MSAPTGVLDAEMLEETVNTVGVGVAMYDESGRFLYVNDAYAELLDTIPDALVGTPVWEVNPGFDADRFGDYWDSFEEGTTRTAETVHEYEGTRTHVSTVTTHIVIDEQAYHIGTVRDISESKEREQQLEQLHTVTRTLMEADSREEIATITARTAETILDYDICVVRFVERGMLRPVALTDWATDHMDQRPSYPLDSSAPAVQAYQRGESVTIDDIATLDDCDHDVARSVTYVPVGEYGVLGIAATVEDAFDRQDVYLASILGANTETALDRLGNESSLERQNERLEAFYDVISHDIPNHLNVATTRLELARSEVDSEHLENVSAAHTRIESVLNDMRTLVKQGEQVTETEWVTLSTIVRDCWENCRLEAGTASLDVVDDARIVASRSRLKQLFENLFWNALDHVGPDVSVRVGTLEEGFYVEDDGPGIPAEERQKVLSPRYTTVSGHAGFGLAIVREIARAHDWVVTITDSSDGGARFEVTGVRLDQL